jgi:hypothetical protein
VNNYDKARGVIEPAKMRVSDLPKRSVWLYPGINRSDVTVSLSQTVHNKRL